MEELSTINEIITSSVRTSSYLSVIISSIVFILYTVIIRIVDYYKTKDKNKSVIEMGIAIKNVAENVAKLNTALDKHFQDNSKKEIIRCKGIIELAFSNFERRLEKISREIILHNNIEANREIITSNISQTVNAEYYNIISVLSLYEINDVQLSTYMKNEWIKDITTNIITIIYNGQDVQSRISLITNKLSVSINNYSTYVYNKAFN